MLELFPERTVFITIFNFPIRWYGLLYVVAFALSITALPRLQRFRSLKLGYGEWVEIIAWVALGVLAGSRVGYALLYEPGYFLAYPQEVFQLWRGGMSSHGGFVGAGLALWWAARLQRVPWWHLADVVTVPAAIGLALGRIGNFINQELYGRITQLPWGVMVPDAAGLRHPVQLYDAALSLGIGIVCYVHLRARPGSPGATLAIFLICYSVARWLLEFVREPEWPAVWGLTLGQLYTLPLFIVGMWLWLRLGRGAVERSSALRHT